MSKQPRQHFSVPEKVAILKRHLLEGTPVSNLCDEVGINPTVFYSWQRLLFEKIEKLEAKLQRKNEVLSELMEEHTLLKKNLGEP
jgi:transposase